MKTEFKKLIAFGVIIAMFASAYTAFLSTTRKQGFLTDHFFLNWLSLIPKTYLLLLPFILVTGPLIKALVERMFRDVNRTK